MFCMLLRKHLVGAKIISVYQPPLERSVILTFATTDEMGEKSEKRLICEMMGRYSNIILVSADGHIIDVLRRVDAEMNPLRQLLPGLIYRNPPIQLGKRSFLELSESEIAQMLQQNQGREPEDAVLSSFIGISPLIAREMVRSGDTAAAISRLKQRVLNADFTPVAVYRNGKPDDFSYMPLEQFGDKAELVYRESFSELLDSHYREREDLARLNLSRTSVRKTMVSARERMVKKLALQRSELAATADREEFRRKGDILSAFIPQIPRGAKSVRLPDFYAQEGDEIDIKLDEKLSPQQNASAYYKEYAKLKSAENHLTALISQGQEELAYIESVCDAIDRASNEHEIAEIKAELSETGYLKRDKSAGKKLQKKSAAPYEYTVDGGFAVLVGRNNLQNDLLTTKLAEKRDLWFHVKNIPGSHCILLTEGQTPSDEALTQAAEIAAYHSSARESDRVSVDYTSVRFVKKPSGAKPGRVIYDKYNTAVVTPRVPDKK